jgi:hypothetical protein
MEENLLGLVDQTVSNEETWRIWDSVEEDDLGYWGKS